jgi:hypothetical protein
VNGRNLLRYVRLSNLGHRSTMGAPKWSRKPSKSSLSLVSSASGHEEYAIGYNFCLEQAFSNLPLGHGLNPLWCGGVVKC